MLVGRDEAIADVLRALRTDGRVVVVGTGGVGKSTLVRHVTSELRAERTVWLDVDRLEASAALAPLLLDSVGDQPLSGESAAMQVRAFTEGRRIVVVLDGADVDVDHAVALTDAVPAAGDGPWVVITSRVRPTSSAASVVRLAPFDVSSDAGLATATELFRGWYARAGGDAGPIGNDRLLAALVALTGGVPLALRVAAAAAAAGGLDATVARLASGDGFEDLTRCIDRSATLLSSTERVVFDALGVTAGWVDVDGAVAISGLAGADAVAALGSLVGHNLIEADADGYRMLPPVHRYARTHVSDTSALWTRCSAWCASLMRDPARLLRHEQDVRLVVARLLHPRVVEETVGATELVRALAWAQFAVLRQHVAADHLRSVLAADALHDPAAIDERIELLRLLAIAESESRGVETALAVLDEADRLVPHARDQDHAWARLASMRSMLLHNAGSVHQALELMQRALTRARANGDRFNEVQSRLNEAAMLLDLGRLDAADAAAAWAVESCDHSMASFAQTAESTRAIIALERGDRALCEALGRKQRSRAASLGESIVAEYLLMLADPAAHATHLTAVEQIDRSRPGEWMVYLEAQAALAMRELVDADHERALTIASDIVVVAEALPLFWMRLEGLLLVGDAALVGADHRQAFMAYRTALSLASSHGHAPRVADAVDGLARLTTAGDKRRRSFAVSAAVRAGCGAVRRPRPWLPALPVQRSGAGSAVPDGWVIGADLSATAVELIVAAAVDPPSGVDGSDIGRLSPAESRVARLVAQGCTNREIGERLHISRRTVETHIVHAFQKLDVQNRTQLATVVNTSDPAPPIA